MQAAVAGPPEHTGQQLLAKVTHLLHGSWGCWCSCGLCGVRDGAGTATPALASAAGSSKDHKCTKSGKVMRLGFCSGPGRWRASCGRVG